MVIMQRYCIIWVKIVQYTLDVLSFEVYETYGSFIINTGKGFHSVMATESIMLIDMGWSQA
jgi:hypothetical protein